MACWSLPDQAGTRCTRSWFCTQSRFCGSLRSTSKVSPLMARRGFNEVLMLHARYYLEICEEASRVLSAGGDLSEIIKDIPDVLGAQNDAAELAEVMTEANAMCWQFPFALGVGG